MHTHTRTHTHTRSSTLLTTPCLTGCVSLKVMLCGGAQIRAGALSSLLWFICPCLGLYKGCFKVCVQFSRWEWLQHMVLITCSFVFWYIMFQACVYLCVCISQSCCFCTLCSPPLKRPLLKHPLSELGNAALHNLRSGILPLRQDERRSILWKSIKFTGQLESPGMFSIAGFRL